MGAEPVFFATQSAIRRWFSRNHDKQRELFVGFYKTGSGRRSIVYQQALDEALCHGWIDGVRRGLDDESYTIRFTPRTKRSIWSAVNIRRAGELEKQGLMHESGLNVFHGRDPARANLYSYESTRELDEPLSKRFKTNKQAWKFFAAQPPSYRRVASWFVMSGKKEETRLRRLRLLIEHSERSERVDFMKPKAR